MHAKLWLSVRITNAILLRSLYLQMSHLMHVIIPVRDDPSVICCPQNCLFIMQSIFWSVVSIFLPSMLSPVIPQQFIYMFFSISIIVDCAAGSYQWPGVVFLAVDLNLFLGPIFALKYPREERKRLVRPLAWGSSQWTERNGPERQGNLATVTGIMRKAS